MIRSRSRRAATSSILFMMQVTLVAAVRRVFMLESTCLATAAEKRVAIVRTTGCYYDERPLFRILFILYKMLV